MNVNKLRRLIKNHVDAQIELSWLSNKDPECHEEVQSLAKRAKKELYSYLRQQDKTQQEEARLLLQHRN